MDELKLAAGRVESQLPDGWGDDTQYLYRASDERLSLSISFGKLSHERDKIITAMFDRLEKKFTSIVGATTLEKREMTLSGSPAGVLSLKVNPGNAESVIRTLIVLENDGVLTKCVMTGPAVIERTLESSWDSFIKNFRLQ